MAEKHALITGDNISGRIPVADHPAHPDGWVDVTPAVLLYDDQAHVLATAAAIEDEHAFRGTHPDLDAYNARKES